MKDKFIKKYMRMAHFIANDQNPCYSRKVGAVITTATGSRVLGTGYNGPPPGTPHTDSLEYLRDFFWPALTASEKGKALVATPVKNRGPNLRPYAPDLNDFLKHYVGKKVCPRKILNCGPGEASHLCTCGHAERHAITNAACDLVDARLFLWETVPCLQCCDAIIQAGINMVYCLDRPEYQKGSTWLLQQGGVKIIKLEEEWVWLD